MKKTILNTAISLTLGISVLSCVTVTQAAAVSFDWTGKFTMLDNIGTALANDSISAKTGNQFQTPVSGTLNYDTVTGTGSATVDAFEFLRGTSPFEVTSFDLKAIGDGLGGEGSLILANMLFDWNGNIGNPVSMVMDGSGFLAGEYSSGGATSARPASDGTYVGDYVPDTVVGPGGYAGYLGLGPIPLATTAWNTSFGPGCSLGDCLGVGESGVLPLIFDTALNDNDYVPNTGGAIGGSPLVDGPFERMNINFNIENMAPAVPVPAAVWLFGSGLLGLIGVARRKHMRAFSA